MAKYSQKPGTLDLELVFGDNFAMSLALTQAGAPWNLSTATISAHTDTSGIYFAIDPVNLEGGEFSMRVASEITALLVDKERWKLEIIDGGINDTVLSGAIVRALP